MTASEPKAVTSHQLRAGCAVGRNWVEKVHRHMAPRGKQLAQEADRELFRGLGLPTFPVFPPCSPCFSETLSSGGLGWSSYTHSPL